VYAFEPSQREYDRLVENCALSAAANVTPVRAAVFNQSGPVSLRVAAQSHSGLNTLGTRFAYDGVDTVRMETVVGTTVDEFVEQQGVAKVSVIKIDVEGSEQAVLAGGSRTLREHRPALVIEVLGSALAASDSNVSEIERLLHDASYQLYHVQDHSARLTPIAHLSETDEQNVVALPVEREASDLPTTQPVERSARDLSRHDKRIK
jgi:FkbM family methyltransferase